MLGRSSRLSGASVPCGLSWRPPTTRATEPRSRHARWRRCGTESRPKLASTRRSSCAGPSRWNGVAAVDAVEATQPELPDLTIQSGGITAPCTASARSWVVRYASSCSYSTSDPIEDPESIAASAAASIRGAASRLTPRGAPSSRARYSHDSARNSRSSTQVHSNPSSSSAPCQTALPRRLTLRHPLVAPAAVALGRTGRQVSTNSMSPSPDRATSSSIVAPPQKGRNPGRLPKQGRFRGLQGQL